MQNGEYHFSDPADRTVRPAAWSAGEWLGALPEALTGRDGKVCRTVESWRRLRRPELLQRFAEEEYGRMPPVCGVQFIERERSDCTLGGLARRIQGDIWFPSIAQPHPFRLLVYLPRGATGRCPVFLGLNFKGNQSLSEDPDVLVPDWTEKPGPRASAQHRYAALPELLQAGFGLATIHNADIEIDEPEGWRRSLRAAFVPAAGLAPDSPACITMWAWGLSRALDVLLSFPEIDPQRVIVWGHSRLGKTALWASANDERFAGAISNDSGCCGASLTRHQLPDGKSETLSVITKVFPHWFCGNFLRYVGHEAELPFDQHELVALSAPRPVYIASAEGDVWADPEGEFRSAVAASPVYRLFGLSGVPADAPPRLHESVGTGVGYHIRAGLHDVQPFDWQAYARFFA